MNRTPPPIWCVLAGAGMPPDKNAIAGIPPTFDAVFQRVGLVPPQLLKSNAWHESGFDPKAKPINRTTGKVLSSARGFGQVVDASREMFNAANGYKYTADDMDDPEKNSMVSAWLLQWSARRINQLTSWPINWDDPLFVAAVLLAYAVGTTTIPEVIATLHRERVPFSGMTTETIIRRAGQLHPASKIAVDPRRSDEAGHGPMASDPAVPPALAAKLRDYFALKSGIVKGKAPPTVATDVQRAVYGVLDAARTPAPPLAGPADYRVYNQGGGVPVAPLVVLGAIGVIAALSGRVNL